MKAIVSRGSGGPETLVLEEMPDPEPGPLDLCVKVSACAINFPDVLIIEDKYQLRPERPFSPGGEISGEIISWGDKVTGWTAGERVIAALGFGGLAERAIVPANRAIRLPRQFGAEEGSALLLTYGTAIHALIDRGRLAAGQTLLVLGAGGGVGIAAVEIGKALGARVIAAVSSKEKAELVRSTGADEIVIYPSGAFDHDGQRNLAALFKQAVGPVGADVILDPVGGDYSEPALRAIAWQGRFLVVGFPAGIARLPLNLTLLKSCDVCGVFWGAFAAREPERNAEHVDRLFRWWSEGKIAPKVSATFPLERAGDAIATLRDRRALGKLVVKV